MTFLEIVRRVNAITGFQGEIKSVDATGYQEVLITAVKDAYEDIQRYRSDWEFMKTSRQISVSDAKEEYTLTELWAGDTVDLANYRFIVYDYKPLTFIPYEDFVLIDYSQYTGGKPNEFTVDPDSKNLIISPVDTNYTMTLHYTRTLDVLSSNTQVPLIPINFHQLIVYMAVMTVSTYLGNPTLYDTYSVKTSITLGQLLRDSNPAKVIRKRPIA